MKLLVDTPKGRGIMVKAFNKGKRRWIRVRFTNKGGEKGHHTKDFLYSQCNVTKAVGPIMRWINRLIKNLK